MLASPSKTQPRLISADVIRVVAMLLVIIMHTMLNFTIRPDFFATKLWFSLEPLVAFSKICVLLFFMLSGFLVINKNRSIKENWQKTKFKILIPLTSFGLINIIYAATKFLFAENNYLIFIQEQLVRITNFPSSPLWFLVVLFFLYMFNPLWQLIFNKNQKPDIAIYLTRISFWFSIVVTILMFPSQKVDILFNSFTAWLGFLFFYLYGGLVSNNWINYQKTKLNLLLIFIGLITTILGDYHSSFLRSNNLHFIWADYTGNYLSLPIVMIAVGTFNLLISAQYKFLTDNKLGQKLKQTIQSLALLSFGIYLTHYLVVSAFTDIIGFDFNKLKMNVYLYNLLNFFLVLIISISLTYVIKKIPKLRMIIGEK